MIGPDLVVRYAHYGRDGGDTLHLNQIEALIARFAERQAPPSISLPVFGREGEISHKS